MALAPGTHLGPYEIQSPLGAGGMGEVYRAKDTRLDRIVAIKVLAQQFSSDPQRKQRFDREAKAISGLNHPHICVLHDVGTQDGVDYLVMECVEGETLADRLLKGALPLEQALRYAAQIADALDRAHRAGIVHRDLKPGNIMLTSSGAKLLDFGLAKPVAPVMSGVTLTAAIPTHPPVTQEGTIVGTFQYMSPEQIEGKETDGRSDIFSFGAVLYEMLTAKKAFEGKSPLSVASAILEKEPQALTAVRPVTPPALERAIHRCLAKDPEDRWQAARDLALELQWIGKGTSQADAAAMPAKRNLTRKWLVTSLFLAAISAGFLAGAIAWRGANRSVQYMHFLAPFDFPARELAISPNGRMVAIVGYQDAIRKNVLYLYELGAGDPKALPETEGASFPFWSADGNSIAFFAYGKLKRIEVAGGPAHTICEAASGRGGTWNKDGVILFTPSGQLISGISQVPAAGGTPTPLTQPDVSRRENSHRWPQFLPDGRHFLYLAANVSGEVEPNGIYVGELNSTERKFIVKSTANALYVEPGYLLFFRDNTLFGQRFDASRLELSGEEVPVLTGVQYLPRIVYAVYAAGGNGLLLAQTGSAVSLSTLDWYDRQGKLLGTLGKPDIYSNLSLSPNGKLLAMDKTDPGTQNADVWIYDLDKGSSQRLTFDPAIDAMPIWSPDSSQIAFTSSREHLFNLYAKRADGSQEEKVIVPESPEKADLYPGSWSPDGKFVLHTRATEIWLMDTGQHTSRPFLKANAVLRAGPISPDGKWAAYSSNETGKWEVYVTSFPEAHGKWQVSSGGGEQPKWRADGKELFFLAADAKLMAVPVKLGASFDVGTPVALFQTNPREMVATSEQWVYDVSKDGQKFLVNTKVRQAGTEHVTVILNWEERLKKEK